MFSGLPFAPRAGFAEEKKAEEQKAGEGEKKPAKMKAAAMKAAKKAPAGAAGTQNAMPRKRAAEKEEAKQGNIRAG